MLIRIQYPLLIVLTVVLACACQPYRATYMEGRYKTVIRSYKYPNLFFPMTIVGRRITTDTATNRIVVRNYYKTSVGIFRQRKIDRTVTYDENNRKQKEVIVENGKRTTIEYVRKD